jgi:hypothetical protein
MRPVLACLGAWAAFAGAAFGGASQDEEARLRRHLQEFDQRWRQAWNRNDDRDTIDSRRADAVLFLASIRHPDVRARLLGFLDARRDAEFGPRVVEAAVQGLAGYATDGEVADAILGKMDRICGLLARTTDDQLRQTYTTLLPRLIRYFGQMDRSVTRPRVERLHGFIRGRNPRLPNWEIQKATVEVLGVIRAKESIPALLDLMLALQEEMREFLNRGPLRGSAGCDGG